MADYLPDEVVVDILARLPVKEIVKCRSACKSWYSLISTKSFQSHHLSKTGYRNLVLFRHGVDERDRTEHYSLCQGLDCYDDSDFPLTRLQEFDSPFKSAGPDSSLKIAGCCNGVVCFIDASFGYEFRAALWNPSIRKLVEIPPLIVVATESDSACTLLNDDYKLVRVSWNQANDSQLIEIYSWRSGLWRMIEHQLSCMIKHCDAGVHLDGVCYWLATRWKRGRRVDVIVSFSFSTEVFDELPVPENDSLVSSVTLADCCKGLLSVVFHLYHYQHNSYDRATVWVLKEGSWTKLAMVDSPHVLRRITAFQENGVLFTGPSGFIDKKESLVWYDLKTREEKELIVMEDVGILYLDANYIESLVFLSD